jgi:hypothetical protein
VTPAQAAASADFGQPSARKTGRNPEWPYVPVIMHGYRQQQVLGLAYATRQEAIAAAENHIQGLREDLERKLNLPNYRALRAKYRVVA